MTALLHDIHIGVQRTAGTTPASAFAIRNYLLSAFEDCLYGIDEDLIILGDLFDGYDIPKYDLLKTYKIIDDWLTIKGQQLTLVVGNHDASNDSSKLSSFAFLAGLFESHPNVQYVDKPVTLCNGMHIIPHLLNQDLLDEAIKSIPECKIVLFHANYDNFFARESDHSLNVSKEQAEAIPAELLYFAHMHNASTHLGGKVIVGGNQWPSSVSDCLDGNDKFMTRFDGTMRRMTQTWDSAKGYAEVDWRNPVKVESQFVRMVGHCPPESAADMANVVAKYRKDSDAFVVTNAVRVSDNEEAAELTLASLEAVNAFDVMDAVKRLLTTEEISILENLK